jgi:predicted nucleic acid-binding protein
MTADFPAVLDACVLVQAALRDTLLRLAEKRLFLPRWSDDIIAELVRTLEGKLGKTRDKTNHLVDELRKSFGDAWVEGYSPLVAALTNDPKDRHVLAAAVKSGAEVVVTFNLKHFPAAVLDDWNVEALHPDDFLIDLYYLNPKLVVHTLHEQAADIDRSLEELLRGLKLPVPKFVQMLSDALGVKA